MEQMTAVAVINGQQIQVSNDDRDLVPIRPICQMLGVSYPAQYEKLRTHPTFKDATVATGRTVAGDGKERGMVCLPIVYLYAWLFSINPNNVAEHIRESMIKFQLECAFALHEHFAGKGKRIAAENRAEIEALEEIARLTQSIGESKQQLASAKKRLETIRAGRLEPQPGLFD